MARQAETATRLEIAPVLQQLMAELSARAAIHMGLMPNPYTRLIARTIPKRAWPSMPSGRCSKC
jgi:hypothetical protein